MDNFGIQEEMNTMLHEIYNKYDATGVGYLQGDKMKEFMKEFAVCESESTLEGFKGKHKKEFNESIQNIIILKGAETSSTTKKNLTVRVNNDDTQTPKTFLSLNYLFEEEKRQTLLNDISPNLNLKADETFVYLKLFCSSPKILKEKVDGIMKVALILMKNLFHKIDFFASLTYEVSLGDDYILIKVTSTHPFFHMISKSLNILTKQIQHLEGRFQLSFELLNSFDDFINNMGEDALKTLVNGSKMNLNVTSNAFYPLIEMAKKYAKFSFNEQQNKKMVNFTMTVLSLLDFNADLALKMGDFEKTIFWNQMPEVKLFSAENSIIKTLVEKIQSLSNDIPIIKKILDACESLMGKVELSLNCPLGLLRLKSESSGLLEVWGILKTIHY